MLASKLNLKSFCILLFTFFSFGNIIAQRNCGTMDLLEQQLQEAPERKAQMEAMEEFIQNYTPSSARNADLYTIPVVVHVVYRNGVQNISDDQILSQIDILNEDFRRLNADADDIWPQAADSEIEFCLASIDPEGNPTNGITRTSTTVNSFNLSDAVKFTSQGGRDAWPAGDYMNFWVCNLAGGLLGYAQFPGGNLATDGIVCDFNYVGNIGTATMPYHLGRTATHEVGHWLGLRHIWGDGGCGVDDGVTDTPRSDASNGGCNIGHVSCGTTDMVQNYMDYTNDACMNLFTEGQKTRMRAFFAPGGFRESLLNSTACILADPTCDDGIQNGDETDVDCGGPDCPACPTCDDGIQNGDETGIDCGGPDCPDCPTCDDGIQNGDETGIDCGGSNCIPCCELEIIEIIVEQTTCGEDNGLVEIFSDGAFEFAEYSIDGTNYFTDNLFQDLAPDNYTAFVKDQNNCTAEMSFEVEFSLEIEVDVLEVNPTCGEDNGEIQLQIFNALNPRVSIDQGPYQNTDVFQDLPAGQYLIDIIDDNNCEWIGNIELNDQSAISYSIATSDATCIDPFGSIIIETSGGIPPYLYSLDNGPFQSENRFDNLLPQNYLISVKDANDCMKTENVQISDLNTLTAEAIISPTTCGKKDGQIEIRVSGGLPPYSYSFNGAPYSDEFIFTQLSSNTYNASVLDSEGCEFMIDNIVLFESSALDANISPQNVKCFGEANGRIEVNIVNGLAPFEYYLNGILDEDGKWEELNANEYMISVNDAEGCEFTEIITINQPLALEANINFSNNELVLEVFGGVEPYQFLWSDGSINMNLPNPTASEYRVLITDENGCQIEREIRDFTSSNENLFRDGSIQLMPNPVKENLFLLIDSSIQEILMVEVYDVAGRQLLQIPNPRERIIQLAVSELSTGTYFVKVLTPNSSGVDKFLKF